ncbi:hypothetical protein K4A83_18595 [Spirulina subsalsa FACHB-351]|uniref:Thylakoid lumen protein n=1 Tax=Spirulina subsalsa FACHB-351 TaxID=234711 RepID=A0ABT3L9Y1_9CYAN|nr:hypothetical protein [Spirulina subsalsa]MCW6038267.1 hypothetical protein [Spirulina subsalsa FACHB-351]
MSNPVTHAFFVGRAFAEVLSEKVEDKLTNALSELGKFDAEQRENLRKFTEEVTARAERELAKVSQNGGVAAPSGNGTADVQETIDNLRAEIASLRAAIAAYRK